MTNLLAIILSLVVLLILIYIKDTQARNIRSTEYGPLYFKLRRFNRLMSIISIIIFVIAAFIDYKTNFYEHSWMTVTRIMIDALSVAIITLPISLSNLYNSSLREKERISYTKYIVTNKYDLKKIYKFNKAGINVIVLAEEPFNTKIKTVTEKEFKKSMLNNNLVVITDNKKFLKNLDYALFEYRDLNKAYDKIRVSRGSVDNLVRTVKYNVLSYFPILLVYLNLVITNFPILYNILAIMCMKLITTIGSEYVFKKMPYDSDLMERQPYVEGKYIGVQEKFFILFTSFCAMFCYSLPYQHIAFEGGTNELALTIFLCTFIFSNIFIVYCLYSESAILKNIFKSLKYWRLVVFIICLIIVSILINYIHVIGTKNIGFHNYTSCITFGLAPILILEAIKLARFLTIKRRDYNESKNNKKSKRS